MLCPDCGKELAGGAEDLLFCDTCGFERRPSSPTNDEGIAEDSFAALAGVAGAEEQPVELDVKYAGFWLRVLAYLIDNLILGGFLAVTLTVFRFAFALQGQGQEGAVVFLYYLMGLPAVFLYFVLLESSEMQATIGKRIVGIKVVDLNGERIAFGQASVRFLAKALSNLTLGIGYLFVAFTRKKQALHDAVAGCFVVKRA